MSEKKLIIVKLDDESYPLMKDYVVDNKKDESVSAPESEPVSVFQDKPPILTLIPQPDWVKPKPSKSQKSSIRFDELSFAIKSNESRLPHPLPPIGSMVHKPDSPKKQDTIQNFSLLAASKELPSKPKKEVRIEPTPSIHSLPPVTAPKKKTIKKIIKKQVLHFKNDAEDGYKVGYLPDIPKEEIQMPIKSRSISKLQDLLGIKASITGRRE